jgi:outer membrane protein assembly factor BamB
MLRILYALLTMLAPVLTAAPEDWPGWRGPTSDGVSTLTNLPIAWSSEQNVTRKIPIEGRGHSSPVIWGDRVFLTTDIEGEVLPGAAPVKHTMEGQPFVHPESVGGNRKHTLKVLCLDTKSGKQVWQRIAYEGSVFDDVARVNTYASPTPITDGKFLYVYFESQGLYKYDMDGALIWKMSLGGISTFGVGTGVSPVLAGDKIVILADQDEGANSFIAAVSARDGKIVWKKERKAAVTWTTPLVVHVGKKNQVIVPATENVIAYDPDTGDQVWTAEGLDSNVVHSAVSGHGMVYVSAGYPKKKTMALRLEPGAGEDRVAWRYEKGTGYLPSPVLYGDYLYLLTDGGLLTCLDAHSGKPQYEGKRFPAGARFTSPLVAFEGKILVTSDDGDTHVVKAGPTFEVLRTNSLDEPVYASLAPARDAIFIRSTKNLYRIALTGH